MCDFRYVPFVLFKARIISYSGPWDGVCVSEPELHREPSVAFRFKYSNSFYTLNGISPNNAMIKIEALYLDEWMKWWNTLHFLFWFMYLIRFNWIKGDLFSFRHQWQTVSSVGDNSVVAFTIWAVLSLIACFAHNFLVQFFIYTKRERGVHWPRILFFSWLEQKKLQSFQSKRF